MKGQIMAYLALDPAGKNDDWNTECYYSFDEDGVMTIHDIQRYKHTIELEAQHDNRPIRPDLPDVG